ncbi:MAG: hypothetical protein M3M96_00075 [Candidatus Eremiobacteraeota bacterium]|nr:hypothetical protein [Candidatus Eremiobacteraeota bacterium]
MTDDAGAANERAIALRRRGNLPAAIAAFAAAIAKFPNEIALHQNLAQALYESGDSPRAIAAHEAALNLDPNSVASHLALYELLQITGEREGALSHQHDALERQRVFSHPAPNAKRSILVLCAPGDWQANIPVDFLFDRETTTVHKLYLIDTVHLESERVPDYEVVWNTIAESPEALPYLALAQQFIERQNRPHLNSAARVLTTARILLPHTLASTGANVAPTIELPRSALADARLPFPFPVIARPVGSHAGLGLEKFDRSEDLPSYVSRMSAPRYFVSPFVDYSSGDGFFRKYRIVFVDREPYPVHLAISNTWMIHYYNALMAEHQWMRDEEARFLYDLKSVFDGARFETLLAIAAAVDLDYFGIDCTIARDGEVLVFEADPAMLVHTSDPPELYPYKAQYVPRIYRAVEGMIDRRKAADT